AGDEIGRTQRGNNNAYCQDNEVSWLDWDLDAPRRRVLEFTRAVLAIRRANPGLRRRRFFSGDEIAAGTKDVTWLRPDGGEMTDADWNAGGHVVGMLIHGWATDERDERGRPVRGDTLLLLVNGGPRSRSFALPRLEGAGRWWGEIDTARSEPRAV